ncbi:MAG: protein kinase domain-containing protein [Chloroflexota bacterium]
MEELIGQTLGRGEYRLVARLGSGGTGAVYEAEQASLRRRVAVKVLWPHLAQTPGLVGRFNREARIAASLEHPHILPVYSFGVEGDLLYLVMRLIRGGSLKDRLRGEGPRRQGWLPRDVLDLARQALPPLDYAHRQGVIHRDLKPDNMLLEPSDDFPSGYRVFLGDFGIARLAQGDDAELGVTQAGDSPGTPAYMAPEQVLDQELDGRADLYAFGVVLFELLVGRVPFRGQTPLSVALQHVQERVPGPRELNPELPAALEPVLLRSLAKDRNDRFPSGAALVAALADAVNGSVSCAPPRPVAALAEPDRSTVTFPDRNREPAAEPVATRLDTETPDPQPIAARRPFSVPAARARPTRTVTRSHRGLIVLLSCVALALAGLAALTALVTRGPVLDASPPLPASPTLATRDAPTLVVSDPPGDSPPPDPRAWVVPPASLGPDWTTRRQSTAGSTPLLRVYEVDYLSASDAASGSVGFSLFSARSPSDADSGMQQLRQSAEARGVVFEPFPALVVDQPSLRGRATLSGSPPSVSVVHLFRVSSVVAAVEVVGPQDRAASIDTEAQHAAQLQRDLLDAALAQ